MIFTARFPVAIMFCLLLIACREKKNVADAPFAIPADSLISPEKMVLILADVHVVEAALLLERNEGKDTRDKPGYYYQGIYKKYHISRARYEQNLTFYREKPDIYAKMYEKVIGILGNSQKMISGKK